MENKAIDKELIEKIIAIKQKLGSKLGP